MDLLVGLNFFCRAQLKNHAQRKKIHDALLPGGMCRKLKFANIYGSHSRAPQRALPTVALVIVISFALRYYRLDALPI